MEKYHYTYLLVDNQTKLKYIGCRTSAALPEQDVYWSSSQLIKDLIKQGHTFSKTILGVWDNRKEAMLEEIRLHQQFNVNENPEYLNKAKQTSEGFDTTGAKFPGKGLGRKDTDEVRLRKSQSAGKHLKGKTLTEEHKLKIAKSCRRSCGHSLSISARQKISIARKGKPPTNKGKSPPKVVCRISDRKEMGLANFMKWDYK